LPTTKEEFIRQKQATQVWDKHLHKGLVKLGIIATQTILLLCYVEDTILIDPDNKEIDKVIQQLKDLQFNVTDEGKIEDYLGVRIQRVGNGKIQMSQPHLIQQILENLNLEHPARSNNSSWYTAKTQSVPAPSTVILQRDVDGEPHQEKWSYRSIIGKLNYSILRSPHVWTWLTRFTMRHDSILIQRSKGISLPSQTYWALLTRHEGQGHHHNA
jgi:hypothetical protein